MKRTRPHIQGLLDAQAQRGLNECVEHAALTPEQQDALDSYLFDTVEGDSPDRIRMAMLCGARLSPSQPGDPSVIHFAIDQCKLRSVIALMECGGDTELLEKDNLTTFETAIRRARLDILKVLLACRPETLKQDRENLRPLLEVANQLATHIHEHGPEAKLVYAIEVADFLEMLVENKEPYPTQESLKYMGVKIDMGRRREMLATQASSRVSEAQHQNNIVPHEQAKGAA